MTKSVEELRDEILLKQEEEKVRKELQNLFDENSRMAINEVTSRISALIRNDDSEYDKAIKEVLRLIRSNHEQE